MSIHQHATLEDSVYFWFGSNDTSGSGNDGATPLCDVRLAGATISDAPILSPTPALISHANYPAGCYEVAVAATAANGFAATNTYAIFCTLTVDSQNPTGFVGSFTLDPIIANVKEVSDDSGAADNLELMYDGTGYIADDTAPSSRSQVAAIGSGGGGALNFANEADNVDSAIKTIVFDGVETSGTNASVNTEDGVYHNITHSGNDIDIVYQFDVGGDRGASNLVFKGYLDSNGDEATIQAYNGSGWDTIITLNGQNGATNIELNALLLSTHTGTGSDLGKVLIRIECVTQSSPDLFTDQLIVEAVSLGSTLGFVGGAVWVDTNNGTSGTGEGIGSISIPSDNIADARTIADANNLKIIHSVPASSYTLAQGFDNFEFIGHAYSINLGGQSIDGSYFFDANVTGTGTTSGNLPIFEDCPIGNVTLPPSIMRRCFLSGTITNSGTGDWFINHSMSRVAGGSSPIFDFGAGVGDTNLNMRLWSGGIQLEAMGDTGTDTASIEGFGQIIEGTCAGGAVSVRGLFTISGITNITLSDDARIDVAQINAEADTALTDYDSPTNAEMEARTPPAAQLLYITRHASSAIPVTFTTAGGSTTAAVLNQVDGAGASATDDVYNGRVLILLDGTLKDQVTDITDYDGGTLTATITAVTTAPTSSHNAIMV